VGVALEVILGAWLAEHEWEDARRTEIEIAANDARNLPLSSVIAYVAIEYKTNHIATNFWDPILAMMLRSNWPPSLSLMSSAGDKLDLVPDMGLPGKFDDGRFIRRFEWDATMREFEITIQEIQGQWHKHTNEFRGNFADLITHFSIDHFPVPHKTEITGGKIDLFFNGTVRRKLSIPPQRVAASFWNVTSDPNPFFQRQLGATNWSYIDGSGILQTTSLPPATLKSITISNETWNNVPLPWP
jgi:hypothetical protein